MADDEITEPDDTTDDEETDDTLDEETDDLDVDDDDLDLDDDDDVVATDDDDDDEDDDEEPEVRGEGGERLQPKQQDEQLCSKCFLLVRTSAPNCPVGDDDCPIFSS
jgi:hypothetical protein